MKGNLHCTLLSKTFSHIGKYGSLRLSATLFSHVFFFCRDLFVETGEKMNALKLSTKKKNCD